MTSIIVWLHLLGVVIGLGANLYFVLVLWPASKRIEDPVTRVKIIADHLQYYHPLFLFGICLTFMTGAIRLTDLKIGFANLYYGTFGSVLLIKFGLTLLIFLIAGGQCFGMGLKLQRMANGVIEGDLPRRERLASAIRKMALYNVVLIAVTLYFGLKLIPLIYGSS